MLFLKKSMEKSVRLVQMFDYSFFIEILTRAMQLAVSLEFEMIKTRVGINRRPSEPREINPTTLSLKFAILIAVWASRVPFSAALYSVAKESSFKTRLLPRRAQKMLRTYASALVMPNKTAIVLSGCVYLNTLQKIKFLKLKEWVIYFRDRYR